MEINYENRVRVAKALAFLRQDKEGVHHLDTAKHLYEILVKDTKEYLNNGMKFDPSKLNLFIGILYLEFLNLKIPCLKVLLENNEEVYIVFTPAYNTTKGYATSRFYVENPEMEEVLIIRGYPSAYLSLGSLKEQISENFSPLEIKGITDTFGVYPFKELILLTNIQIERIYGLRFECHLTNDYYGDLGGLYLHPIKIDLENSSKIEDNFGRFGLYNHQKFNLNLMIDYSYINAANIIQF